jgi:glycosyltransferase involved in cell wall biosynthesis
MGGVALIIPVINEAETIAAVVRDVPRSTFDVVIVVDGGSTDMTAARARQAGALVIVESQSGYGAACLAGIRAAPADCHIVAFIDGDGSDDPHDIPRLVSPIQSGAQDFVIRSRVDAASREHGDPPGLRGILRRPCHSSALWRAVHRHGPATRDPA